MYHQLRIILLKPINASYLHTEISDILASESQPSDIVMRAMEKNTRMLRSFQYLFKENVNERRQTQQTRSTKLLEKNAYTCSFL